jgi:hypothetical protein
MPDWTPEQKKAIYAEMQKLFTVEDLLGYINDTDEKIPMEQVMAEAEALLAELKAKKARATGCPRLTAPQASSPSRWPDLLGGTTSPRSQWLRHSTPERP